MAKKVRRPQKANAGFGEYAFLAEVFTAPTMVAVGVDPGKGLFHACIKTGQGEKKWTQPLNASLMAVFSVMRSLVLE